MGILVDLAKDILQQAEKLESQMQNASAALPTFDAAGPLSYPPWSEHPEIYRTRSTLIESSKSMFRLALGPSDAVLSMTNIEKMEGYVLNAINHYKIVELVPVDGSITFGELAAKISVGEELLTRIMRFAFSMDVFKEEPVGSVSHTSFSRALGYIAGWTWLLNRPDFSATYSSMPQAMQLYTEPRQAGKRQLAFQIGNDTDLEFFDKLNKEPDGMTNFGEAMRSHTSKAGFDPSYLLECYDWASLGEGPVVDLGGGTGHISVKLAEKFSDLHIVVQDLPTSEAIANKVIPSHLKSRVTFQHQDFFKPQSKELGAKVFFMKAIMHDWPDEQCAQILRHLIPEVENGAKILLCDRISPPSGRKATHLESMTLFMDLLMFNLLGAKERNHEQWVAMIAKTDPRLKILDVFQQEGSEQGIIVVGF